MGHKGSRAAAACPAGSPRPRVASFQGKACSTRDNTPFYSNRIQQSKMTTAVVISNPTTMMLTTAGSYYCFPAHDELGACKTKVIYNKSRRASHIAVMFAECCCKCVAVPCDGGHRGFEIDNQSNTSATRELYSKGMLYALWHATLQISLLYCNSAMLQVCTRC